MHRRTTLAILLSTVLVAPLPASSSNKDDDREPTPRRVEIRNYSLAEIADLPIARRREIRNAARNNSRRKDKTTPALTVGGMTEAATLFYLAAGVHGPVDELNAGIRRVQARGSKGAREAQALREAANWHEEFDNIKAELERIEAENKLGWRLRAATLKKLRERALLNSLVFEEGTW